MNAIIFGCNGQDGKILSDLLIDKKIKVVGVARSESKFKGDISNYNFVKKIIKLYKPDYIFHFAANSTTNHSALFDNHSAISTGTFNLLESVKLFSPNSKVFLSGSAMQFKNKNLPINEKTPFEASSPYSVSRTQSTFAGRYFRNVFGLKIYTGFLFNHDSIYRSDRHINMKILKSALQISKGSLNKLEVGDILVKKEFNFAGDIVNAIWRLINQDEIFEAVIGSGKSYKIKDWIKICFKNNNLNWEKYIVQNSNYLSEYKNLVSDPKLIKSIGWNPETDINQLYYKMKNQL